MHAFIWQQLLTCLHFFLFTNVFAVLSVRRDLFTYMLHCLVGLPLDCGGSVFVPCFFYTLLSVLSSYAIILTMVTGCFTLIVVLMSCDCWCSVALPRGDVV